MLFQVFKRATAQRLREEGFQIIDASVNKKDRSFVVYYFEDSKEFREAFERVQRELKEGK